MVLPDDEMKSDDEPVSTRADEDRLPWLEAVEEDERGEGPPAAKLIGAIIIGLVAIGVIVGGLFWLGNRSQEGGTGELIAAPEGDYKVKPDQPGGMAVAGEGDTAFAASAGAEPKARINTAAVPERPVERAAPAPAPSAQPGQRTTAPPTRAPAPAPAPATPAKAAPPGSGGTIQLGAFSTQAGANSAWTALSGRFRYLKPLNHSIVPVKSGDRTLYRLRAWGPDATGICRRLQVAGEDCAITG